MPIQRLLIANRGEIAIRIARAAADLGISTLAVFSEDDEQSLHTRVADESSSLTGMGARAYLDADSIIATAEANGCDAIHPGYGFLSERADFAAACGERGITFVGPSEYHLSLFGDKARARAAAVAADVPILRGYDESVSIDQASEFFQSLGSDGSMMIKAIAGGGGRGTRTVRSTDELEEAYARCQSEARAAFDTGLTYTNQEFAQHLTQFLGPDAAVNLARFRAFLGLINTVGPAIYSLPLLLILTIGLSGTGSMIARLRLSMFMLAFSASVIFVSTTVIQLWLLHTLLDPDNGLLSNQINISFTRELLTLMETLASNFIHGIVWDSFVLATLSIGSLCLCQLWIWRQARSLGRPDRLRL